MLHLVVFWLSETDREPPKKVMHVKRSAFPAVIRLIENSIDFSSFKRKKKKKKREEKKGGNG